MKATPVQTLRHLLLATVLTVSGAGPSLAQQSSPTALPPISPIPTPAEPESIPLHEGALGSASSEQWVADAKQRMVRNVTRPTLTPFLPAPGKATGAAVIVVPGGGFNFVSMDNEGYPVARHLADHGIAAFILKYRTEVTPTDHAEYQKLVAERRVAAQKRDPNVPRLPPADAAADGLAALKLVRARAAQWGVQPARIGMLGFSAGAIMTLSLVTAPQGAEKPSFVGLIYGQMIRVALPGDAPPAFIALAANDALFSKGSFGLVDAWREAGRPVEFHLYQDGGHGFGTQNQSGTYAAWKDQFTEWMKWNGWLGPVTK